MNEPLQLLVTNSDAGSAFAAIASAVAAILALAVSVISMVLSVKALKIQRRHNELSVRPLPEVTVADYEDSLRVKIRNNGSGPLLINSLSISDGTESKHSLIQWMPTLSTGRPWTAFSHALLNRSLLPGDAIPLLELTESEGELEFARCRDQVRMALSSLTVFVEYTDVYNSPFQTYTKSLEWFGRHK